MADHRAEEIAQTLKGILAHLPTTRERVYRGRARRLNEDELPALLINLSREEFLGKTNPVLIDRDLIINVEGYARTDADGENLETILNRIRKEVTIAIMADVTLGLTYVHDSNEGNAGYTFDEETENGIGVIATEWVVTYRRSATDPSQ